MLKCYSALEVAVGFAVINGSLCILGWLSVWHRGDLTIFAISGGSGCITFSSVFPTEKPEGSCSVSVA